MSPSAEALPYTPYRVTTPDGVGVAVQEWGRRDGPAILFIHGFSQSALSWSRQTQSALAEEFRLVAYDIRGHGASDKPLDPAFYREPRRWAQEVAAVIEQVDLHRPVLVGWSYGGRIIGDYLAQFGDAGIAGIVFVAGAVKTDAALFGPARRWLPPMSSEDLATNIAATRGFLRGCFARQPAQDEFEMMLAFNAMVPPPVRAAMGNRSSDYDGVLAAIRTQVLAIHGEEDAVILPGMAHHIAAKVPGARLALYPGIGHAPFWEDAVRFNADLVAFMRGVVARVD